MATPIKTGTAISESHIKFHREYNLKTKPFFLQSWLTGMTFSPIGEEFFFRGIVHSGFAKSIGETRGSIVDSAAFALVHISHFGLLYVNNQWKFMTWPALIWIRTMFLASSLFFIFKKYYGSILSAIICHAAFNLRMIYCIFYLLQHFKFDQL